MAQRRLLAHLAEVRFHCAHAVLRAMEGWFPVTPALLDATAGFVGGTAGLGLTCSALTAGVMGLVLSTTCFDEAAYRTGLGEAMPLPIDEFSLAFPGIQEVQHEYFHAVVMADEATRRRYPDRAHQLGLEFEARPLAASG